MSTAKFPVPQWASLGSPKLQSHHTDGASHVVQFYGEDESLLDSLTRFVGGAVMAGDSAVVVATRAHRDALVRRLKASGLDTGAASREGRYVAMDAAETLSKLMLRGRPDAVRFGEVIGTVVGGAVEASETGKVSIFGEMVALLWAEAKAEAAIELERMWNELRQTHSFSLLCAYPIGGFNREEHGESFLRICAEHSDLIPMEEYTSLGNDEHRMLHIVRLQQKAQALDTEMLERQEAQQTLKRRDAEIADLLENALEGIQQTGADQRILWTNRALLNLLGYTQEEYFGHHLSEFYVEQSTFEEFWAKLMQREEIYDFPADLKCKDGSVRHVLIHSNGLWENGRLLHTRTFIRDITERRQMERTLQLANDELERRVKERTRELTRKNVQIVRQAEILDVTNQGLRELSARLMQVQDEERRRIARDLHDSTGQALALLSMNLSVLEMEAGRVSPDLAKGLSENGAIVREISEELRTLSYLLHPPLLEEMGLSSALQWYIDGFGKRSGIHVEFEQRGLERLPKDLEIAIFRAVQECLTNIHRHSGSATASLSLEVSSGGILLKIKDAGKGISSEVQAKIASVGASGVGLRGMRERIKDFGGELEIESRGNGTEIRIVLPMPA